MMASDPEISPSWCEEDEATLLRLRLERDTVTDTIEIVRRQMSIVSDMLATLQSATVAVNVTTIAESPGLEETPAQDNTDLAVRCSATERCLNVPGLLERILLCLEPVHVFGLQRINGHFRATIADSTLLRQKMLLEPSPFTHTWTHVHDLIGSKKVTHAARPFEFQLFPHHDADHAHFVLELWIDLETVRRYQRDPDGHFDLERDVRSDSWRRMRLDAALDVQYFGLVYPYTPWPESYARDCLDEPTTLGELVERASRSVERHCRDTCEQEVWEAMRCLVVHKGMVSEDTRFAADADLSLEL